ncbi:unnamed protein product [Adineta ricciae]|uniref:Uncharacterized protein n=1 Tax=Adineta ricciae TaxID=249248 RepID=A0A815UR66_ADIRI|nr:unnamed protein product [Adineta ricciae]CAF1671755.1 unnamed protein product [Adineta ricciae]
MKFHYLLIVSIFLVDFNQASKWEQCRLPRRNSCTESTPTSTKLEGLGVYYEKPCHGAGCGFFRPYCRLCWIDPYAPGRLDRPQCPKCVSEHFEGKNSANSLCHLPRGRSCTSLTPTSTKLEGLGVYYEKPCHGAGCGFFQPYCRLCWIDPEAPGKMDRPECPPCVAQILNEN